MAAITSACGGPGEDRQAEGAFGDEAVAADRLEGFAEPVGGELVVARDHPDFAAALDADLGRAGNVAGGVERDRDAADPPPFSPADALGRDLAQPVTDHRQRRVGCQVGAAAGPGVVGMAMGDQRPLHRPPGVDVEIGVGAVEPGFGQRQQRRPPAAGGGCGDRIGIRFCPRIGGRSLRAARRRHAQGLAFLRLAARFRARAAGNARNFTVARRRAGAAAARDRRHGFLFCARDPNVE